MLRLIAHINAAVVSLKVPPALPHRDKQAWRAGARAVIDAVNHAIQDFGNEQAQPGIGKDGQLTIQQLFDNYAHCVYNDGMAECGISPETGKAKEELMAGLGLIHA